MQRTVLFLLAVLTLVLCASMGSAYSSAGLAGYSARLKSVTLEGSATSYEYDTNGNRAGGGYDAQDRLTAREGRTYTYTDAGSLLSQTDNGQTTTYRYDAVGNLRKVQLPSGEEIGYRVDGLGRRILFAYLQIRYNPLWVFATEVPSDIDCPSRGTAGSQPGCSSANVGSMMAAIGVISASGQGLKAAFEAGAGAVAKPIDVNLGQYGSPGRTSNCVNCAIATDATLGGSPATAMPGCESEMSSLVTHFGGNIGDVTTIEAITSEMQAAGPGARGVWWR